ncbi:MAG: hypothetical protein DI577_09775 [Microbacterium sp.]|nr:MAG: hypothetical protein DI577_09775 [Microbacterium sp.]PZU33411.1 MAG: hypothetical protein DI575_09775 [Microbacterium sp.]
MRARARARPPIRGGRSRHRWHPARSRPPRSAPPRHADGGRYRECGRDRRRRRRRPRRTRRLPRAMPSASARARR